MKHNSHRPGSCCPACAKREKRKSRLAVALRRSIRSRRELGSLAAEGDPLIWTPAAVRNELDRARRTLDAVNSDVSRAAGAKKISGDEWKQWRAFYVASHGFTVKASGWTGANVARARTIIGDAIKWRDLIKARGVKPSGTAPDQPEDRKTPGWVKWAVGGAALLAVPAAISIFRR